MYDVVLLSVLLAVSWIAWRQPWLGGLGLVFLIAMHPQGYASAFMKDMPVYLCLFLVVTASTVRQFMLNKSWPSLFWDWRLGLLLLLWAHFALTTLFGLNPWFAWPKLIDVAKILPTLILLLVLMDSREKLFAMNMVMALSVAAVVLKGGFWALMTGFQNRVYGPPGSNYSDNNEFAIAVAMMIPFLMLWYQESRGKTVKGVLGGMMALGFVSVVSSWSRGGMLSLVTLAGLLWWQSRRKVLAFLVVLVAMGLAFLFMPDAWHQRMGNLLQGELDGSAQSRLDVWQLGWNHALSHPWLGGGFGGWVYLSLPTGGSLDWHSAYVTIATEHGLVGLALWLGLLLGNMFMLTRLVRLNRVWRLPSLTPHAAMIRASLAVYMVGAAFLGIAYWELLYLLIVSAVLLDKFACQERSCSLSGGVQAGKQAIN